MEKENLKREILNINQIVINQIVNYFNWYSNLLLFKNEKVLVTHMRQLKAKSLDVFPYYKPPLHDFKYSLNEFFMYENDTELILTKIRFIESLVQYWHDIATLWNTKKEDMVLSTIMTFEIWKQLKNSPCNFIAIEFEKISLKSLDLYIIGDIEFIQKYLIELKSHINFTPEQGNKLIWKGQKNQLYSVLRQLKNDTEFIGNSYNSLADFLIQSVTGFENTSKETIEKELKKSTSLPKLKRIKLDIEESE